MELEAQVTERTSDYHPVGFLTGDSLDNRPKGLKVFNRFVIDLNLGIFMCYQTQVSGNQVRRAEEDLVKCQTQLEEYAAKEKSLTALVKEHERKYSDLESKVSRFFLFDRTDGSCWDRVKISFLRHRSRVLKRKNYHSVLLNYFVIGKSSSLSVIFRYSTKSHVYAISFYYSYYYPFYSFKGA